MLLSVACLQNNQSLLHISSHCKMLASSGLRSSTFAGQGVSSRRIAIACPCRHTTVSIEAAHKKGAGSTKNGRDSESKRRGIKVFGGQPVKAGGIIFRQCGSTVSASLQCVGPWEARIRLKQSLIICLLILGGINTVHLQFYCATAKQ